MCEVEKQVAHVKQAAEKHAVTTVEVTRMSQGTQVGWRTRPPPLRHHASEMLLTPKRVPNGILRPLHSPLSPQHLSPQSPQHQQFQQLPFYTTRSAHPYESLYATRKKRRQQYGYQTDSPTSSLDYLPLKSIEWNPDTNVNHFRVNGIIGSGDSCRSCRCSCHGANCGTSAEEAAAEGRSPETLSWRRLHMSRAKLKATATTSELLSGFAMIAMVELQINEPTYVPEWLFVMFAICTTVLVAVHIFALMISTYLLPNIDAASKMTAGDVLRESPHERMRGFIELAWAFSTVLGLFLFLVEIAILCWVKFWDYSFAAATAATVIVIPVLIVFVAFAVHFYHSLVVHKYKSTTEDLEELETIKRNLDSATLSASSPV